VTPGWLDGRRVWWAHHAGEPVDVLTKFFDAKQAAEDYAATMSYSDQ
jgi:hypothetical protein